MLMRNRRGNTYIHTDAQIKINGEYSLIQMKQYELGCSNENISSLIRGVEKKSY